MQGMTLAEQKLYLDDNQRDPLTQAKKNYCPCKDETSKKFLYKKILKRVLERNYLKKVLN